ncbi:cytochrome P450 family monooxygenase [Rhizoctonia solani 123E]|uniref:Cytochrome P450 family monooxygenase n=1 Tax=Rhizoctonia solani 123E TaxID=1423351 RepID=A0A074SB34_9AGAM|nr:cytochrome P450 family monooxygenase [Rhizoctonia solani 123E]
MYLLVIVGVLTSLYYLDPYDYRRRFHGPRLAAFSNLWLARAAQATKRQTAVDEMHQKYGTFVRIAPNHISIADPAAFEAVYGHSSRLIKTDFYNEFFIDEPDMFTTQDRAAHAIKRKRVANIFSPQTSWHSNHAYNSTSGSFVDNGIIVAMPQRKVYRVKIRRLLKGVRSSNVRNVKFAYLGFDVIGDLALGSSFGLVESQRDSVPLRSSTSNHTTNVPIVGVTLTISEVGTAVATWPAWCRPLIRYLPWNYYRSKGIFDFARLTITKVDEKLDRVKRAGYQPEDRPMVDLIDKLLELKDESGAHLSRQELLSEAFLFLFAGGDTTSNTLWAFCYLMATHRDVQKKLQAELDEYIPLELEVDDHDSTTTPSSVVASFDHIKNLPYLNACIKEVMRFQSVVGMGLPRAVPTGQTFTFKDQTFKEGSVISVPSLTINRMDVWGPDAKAFIPERWMGPKTAEFTKYHAPFSFGTRACIGRNLATMQVSLVAATLFR